MTASLYFKFKGLSGIEFLKFIKPNVKDIMIIKSTKLNLLKKISTIT